MHGLVSIPPNDSSIEPSTAAAAESGVIRVEERTWLRRHCRGDISAFPALLEAYRRPVFSYLVRAGVAESDRDDLFQSIFLRVHAAAARYDPARPLAPWLFTIVANAVRDHFRRQAVPPMTGPGHDPPEPLDPSPGPERIAAARETMSWLEQALSALPAVQREVLLLTTIAGLPQLAVAATLNLPLNTVKTHLRRTRLALAASLARSHAARADRGDTHGETDEPV